MSTLKLGLAVMWPAFWIGVPIKIVICLLLLAMGLHFWEMPGLAFLLILSIPIDIWALGISARTVFLDRLRLEPPDGLGVALWWRIALVNAIYLPLAAFIESQTVQISKSIAAAIMDMIKLPVAERITIELNLWGVPATIVLLVLALGWLWIVGRLVRAQAAKARPADAPYPALVRQWDLSRVPADQALMLTVFTATGIVVILGLWAAMPVTTPHPHQDYKKPETKSTTVLRPAETLHKTEKLIAQAEAAVETLESKAAKDGKKGKDNGKKPESAAAPAAKSEPAHEHKDDGHKH